MPSNLGISVILSYKYQVDILSMTTNTLGDNNELGKQDPALEKARPRIYDPNCEGTNKCDKSMLQKETKLETSTQTQRGENNL